MPVQVCRPQDDDSHLQLHNQFKDELMNMDPMIQQQAMPALMAHIAAHLGQAYRKRMDLQLQQSTGIPLPPFDPNNAENNEELPPDVENQIAQAVARYVPPPPPPAPPPQAGQPPQSEGSKDEMASREADRKDMLAKREADRLDAAKAAELKRDGLISDVPAPPQGALPPPAAGPPGPIGQPQ
jgi:hypothetical protein